MCESLFIDNNNNLISPTVPAKSILSISMDIKGVVFIFLL